MSSLGIARRRTARPPQAAPSPRTTLFLIRAASAALEVGPPCSSTRLRAATAAAGARRATTGTAGPYRLPDKPWWKVHRDFIPWTTTPSTRPCRKCVNPLPDVAAAVRVGDGYIVDENRPSKRFLGCENVSYGQKKSIPLNGFYTKPVQLFLAEELFTGCVPKPPPYPRSNPVDASLTRSRGTRVRAAGPLQGPARGIERCHGTG